MRKWLPRAYGTHHNTASTARNDKNPTREFRRINPGLILLKMASTVGTVILDQEFRTTVQCNMVYRERFGV